MTMAPYAPPIDDIGFLLNDVFGFDAVMADLPGYEEVNAELALTVLAEGGRFCAEVLEPLNRSGDEEGCRLADGVVTTPKGFAEAYRAFAEAGWTGLSGDPAYGGQGLPRVVQILLDEMLSSANFSFGLFPGLTRGAVEAIGHHADDALKQTYLPKMISGEWTGAMALTEAHAGTDLGLLKTRAEPLGDGRYRITGSKIFISSGDHDFGGNIVHLVLARLPDAPAGVKGISLFLVPKHLTDLEGGADRRNGFSVGALEHKMGIHAQPTCVMNYDGALGFLVGEPSRGLNAMFTMMNAERLFVGIQGLGIGEIALQKASAYARERLQGRSADGRIGPVPILDHADVRRMLLTGRALTEGGRALAIWTALQMDIAARHPDPAARQEADGFVALLTPVIKAALTDWGFAITVEAQQVFGGHGYIREWGMEQYVRDARIAQIYEGTNGVQAMDLAGRKLMMENGQLPHRFFALMRAEIKAADAASAPDGLAQPVLAALADLETATAALQEKAANAAEANAAAVDYLRLFALVALGWMWVRMAVAEASRAADNDTSRKRKLAALFAARILPQAGALKTAILSGAQPLMVFEDDEI